jgi:glycosyltransferase involved in cell wall biosynthesis
VTPLVARARRAAALARRLPRWAEIARATARGDGPRVYYGHDRIPGRDEPVHGGAVKFQALQEAFPNEPRDFNLLYLGSSTLPADARALVALARRRGAALVWNQNGVAYPGWHGSGYEARNRRSARVLHAADHVFFQSEFCRVSSDRFLGERQGPSEILYNPVDTERFAPRARDGHGLVLLLGGNQYQRYRFEAALRTLALVRDERDARLLVTGRLSWSATAPHEGAALIAELGLADCVELTGPYTQAEAPALIRRGDILLHTKYNDPCPTVVLEALATGLPVVYSASGGTPELVGPDAGVGVRSPLDWEQDHPPPPEALARGVLDVAGDLDERSAAARERSLRFDVRPWIERHREVFEELVRR